MSRELRAMFAEARAAGDSDSKSVSGLGIIYDKWVEIWPGYKERIKKGAVKMAETVKSYFNHDPSKVLSTSESDPALQLRETDKGLEYESPIPPTSYGKDLEVNLERKNVRGSSFSFSVPKHGSIWSEDKDGTVYRDIAELTLYEVGPVTDPAYVQTTAALRSAKEAVEEYQRSKPPLARLHREKRQRLAEIDA